MCQMYLYVQALSYVASVLIMVAVCVERYVAIMQPFQTRSVFTTARLRVRNFTQAIKRAAEQIQSNFPDIALLILFLSLPERIQRCSWSL